MQNKNEAKAAAMPESKRWIAPEIIQRNFEANEAAKAAEEARRKAAALERNCRMVSALNKQVAEHEARDAAAKAAEREASAKYLATAGAGQARCVEERRKRLQLELQVRHRPCSIPTIHSFQYSSSQPAA
jgi:hypothetical protein